MRELQQTQGRSGPREKSAWVPLVLLIVPAVTFLLFLVIAFTMQLSSRGTLPSTPQPPWLHFCLTHQRSLARMCAVGLLCSGLNSLVTLAWFRWEERRRQAHRAEGITQTALYFGGAYLLVALLMAAAGLCKVYQGPRSLTHSPVLDGPIAECVLDIGLLILVISFMGLVTVTSLTAVVELFARLKRRAPGCDRARLPP